MIKPIIKLVKAMSSNTNPGEIAHAFALGILLGFMPKGNLLWYIVFMAFLFMRIQKGAFTLSLLLGAILAPLLDPVFDRVGWWILTQENAIPTYQWLLNVPFVSFTKFNNTIVMGSLACGLIAYIPLYWLGRLITMLWRKYVAASVNKWKVVKILKQVPFIEKIAKIAGGK